MTGMTGFDVHSQQHTNSCSVSSMFLSPFSICMEPQMNAKISKDANMDTRFTKFLWYCSLIFYIIVIQLELVSLLDAPLIWFFVMEILEFADFILRSCLRGFRNPMNPCLVLCMKSPSPLLQLATCEILLGRSRKIEEYVKQSRQIIPSEEVWL